MGDEISPPDRCEEDVALGFMERRLGIEVAQRDDGSADKMVDALFRLPGGIEGAVEVTTLADQPAMAQEGSSASMDWTVDGSNWYWLVHIKQGVRFQDLKAHLPNLILTCERFNAPTPKLVPAQFRGTASFRWLADSDTWLTGSPTASTAGIDVLSQGEGGAVRDDLEQLPAWLDERLQAPDLQRKVLKLRGTGRSELHLFLRVHSSGMPWRIYHPLAFKSYVPSKAPDSPCGLSGIWVVPGPRNPILWWSAHSGWERIDLPAD